MSQIHPFQRLAIPALVLTLAAPLQAGEAAAVKGSPAPVGATDPSVRRPPENAAAALVRAAAAYEYGDMNQIVEAARPVTEGYLLATNEEQAEAYRLLGIGLFLTDRMAGAEHAFNELLNRVPSARLDPTTTRPELVAFFEYVRRQRLNKELSARRYVYNLLPPLGQFQNGDRVTGWVLLGVESASLATCLTTAILLKGGIWLHPDGTPRNVSYDTANAARTANRISLGVFAATFVYGVIDGLIGYSRPVHSKPMAIRFQPTPNGFGLTF
jgi:hypothetical protein